MMQLQRQPCLLPWLYLCLVGGLAGGGCSTANAIPEEPSPLSADATLHGAPPIAEPAVVESPPLKLAPLNAEIVAQARRYPMGSAHGYYWPKGEHTDGTSRDLFYGGVQVAQGDPAKRVHCAGITFEVWLQALTRVSGSTVPGLEPAELLALKEAWYVRDGRDSGMAEALVELGLGEPVTDWRALKPGDLIQFWRNTGKGHSAIFMEYRRNSDGSLRSLVYWSAQSSSEGIGQRIVSIGPGENQISPERFYAVRPLAPVVAGPDAAVDG